MSSARWPLWGSYAFLGVEDPEGLDEARALADRLLAQVDKACSRFRDDAELVRANRRPGTWTGCGPVLVDAVRAALAAAEATDGLVDPCLGRSLVSLGYDRDFDELRALPALPFHDVAGSTPRPEAWREVLVADDAVRVPEGVTLDLGATAKAWAADRVAEQVSHHLGCTVVVSLGGDLRVAGPGSPSWPVAVTEHPDGSGEVPVMVQVGGGLATSTTVVRRWGGRGTPERHHLLDPRTGLPADGTFRTVTAAGATCLDANAATVAAVVLGAAAPAWLEARGVTARLVDRAGAVRTVGAWPAPTHGQEVPA